MTAQERECAGLALLASVKSPLLGKNHTNLKVTIAIAIVTEMGRRPKWIGEEFGVVTITVRRLANGLQIA